RGKKLVYPLRRGSSHGNSGALTFLAGKRQAPGVATSGMRNIKLTLSYDGTDFSGWQRQPGRRTVQQVLEEAIGRLTGIESPTNASGRTDAGVHALGQVAHFLTASRHPPEVFVKALNAMLPRDVRVREAREMPQ